MEFLFLTKKAATFFVEPLGLIIVLNLIGIYFLYKSSYKKAKIMLVSALFLLLFFSYPPVGNSFIQKLESQYKKYSYHNINIEYVHVLGSGHHENAFWPLSSQIGNAGLKRTIEGVAIYKNSPMPKPKLVFTGYPGFDNQISNAEINASIAKIAGVHEKDIIINAKAKDTKEEAKFAKTLFKDAPFVLVTSASHMPRAISMFQNQALNPIPAPTDFHGKHKKLLSVPNIVSLEKSRIVIHELLGQIWYFLMR